jgi:hypothetical protein
LNEKEGYWAAVFGECDLTVGGTGGLGKAMAETDWEPFYRVHGKTPPSPPTVDLSKEKSPGLPKAYGLSQNYPNPFSARGGSAFGGNPKTTIGYQIPDAGFVTLAIYNTMGQVVKKLVAGQQNAGYCEVVWDGKDENGLSLGSGMYLVKMEAGDFSTMRKVLLLR